LILARGQGMIAPTKPLTRRFVLMRNLRLTAEPPTSSELAGVGPNRRKSASFDETGRITFFSFFIHLSFAFCPFACRLVQSRARCMFRPDSHWIGLLLLRQHAKDNSLINCEGGTEAKPAGTSG
jgi:hypothetical protein